MLGDYLHALAFASQGVPTVLDWCDDSEGGIVAEIRSRKQAAILSTIG